MTTLSQRFCLREQLIRTHVAELDALGNIHDPYRLLLKLHDIRRSNPRAVAAHHLMPHYAHFISLVASYPDADKDALLYAAREVFTVRIRVMRADVAQAQQAASR